MLVGITNLVSKLQVFLIIIINIIFHQSTSFVTVIISYRWYEIIILSIYFIDDAVIITSYLYYDNIADLHY